MSKRWKYILVLTFVVPSLFAQSESPTESMTEEQLEQFNQSKLSVDVGITTSAFAGGFGMLSLESYRRWTGRQGFDRVSEPQFYNIAGYPEEAKKADTYKSVGWGLLIAGGAMVVGGLAWMMLGVTATDYDNPNYLTRMNTSLYGGLIISLVGVIPLTIGSTRVRRNWSSAEQAQIAADKFNRSLAKRILSE